MKVVVVGSNPSQKSPDKTAFSVHTRSGRTIREWFFSIPDVCFVNVSDEPTANNKPLKMYEINANLKKLSTKLDGFDRVVAVGVTAQIACKKLGVPFFPMFHPSGRCRKQNDPGYVKTRIVELLNYLK